jgi:hypothetical protein
LEIRRFSLETFLFSNPSLQEEEDAMWTTLTLMTLVASAATGDLTAPLTPGTEIRLTAGPAVHVPGLFSGTSGTYTALGHFDRRDGLLVFTRDDGSTEGVIAPGSTVQGRLGGADADYVYLRRGGEAPERIHRASIARAQALFRSGRNVRKGALIGGAIGAGLGVVFHEVATAKGTDWPPSLGAMAILSALGGAAGVGVGTAVGALSPGARWREVPLEALPGRGGPPPSRNGGHEGRTGRREGATRWTVTLDAVPVAAVPPSETLPGEVVTRHRGPLRVTLEPLAPQPLLAPGQPLAAGEGGVTSLERGATTR